ncbi:MAG: hypothetical protein ACP5VQ_05695 [Phycisphaerae bacterium]
MGRYELYNPNRKVLLQPYLDILPISERKTFLAAYQDLITKAYPPQSDGRVLFPFRRLFLIAYR